MWCMPSLMCHIPRFSKIINHNHTFRYFCVGFLSARLINTFQNKDTYARLCDVLIDHVVSIRAQLPQGEDGKALLVADAAPQHADCGKLEDNGIRVVIIPKNMTHVFQPADQYVIACLKAYTQSAWDNYVEELFAQHGNDEAVAELMVSHIPTLRKRKYALVADIRVWLFVVLVVVFCCCCCCFVLFCCCCCFMLLL